MNGSVNKTSSARKSGLGLDDIGDLSGMLSTPVKNGPLELNLSVIDEDVNQPRTAENPGFSPESIAEIGATIKARGVKSPISVRENLDEPGRYIINHGARRFRGSIWAEKATIPAFIDNDYNEADQVIENLQRNELTPREIADYIGRELAKGKKKGEIAKELGKSPAFITQHVTLLDLPDPIAEAFNSGRVRDVTVINELVTAYKKDSAEVENWLSEEEQEISRGSVKLLREFLDEKGSDVRRDPDTPDFFTGKTDNEAANNDVHQEMLDEIGGVAELKAEKIEDPDKLKKAIVQVRHDDRPARLILTKRPPVVGMAWVKYDDDGQEFEANLTEVQLIALVEG